MFTIKTIHARALVACGIDSIWAVEVVVHMPVKAWTKHRDNNQLGMLYGVDISNAVFAINSNIPAHNPTVDSSSRAKNGIKTIHLSYRFTNPDKAESLGLKLKRFKNGIILPERGGVSFLYDSRTQKPELKVV